MPNEVPALTIRRRARELRGLGERKAATFHRTQVDRSLEVLTLRQTPAAARSSATNASWTPAISSNYLQVRLSGEWPANQMMRARMICAADGHVDANPETTEIFAVKHVTRG
jgi:hypothetical protein